MRRGYLYALGLAVLVYAYSRTAAGAGLVADVTDSIVSSVRGLRNNNPGNLRWAASNNWEGQTGKDAAGYATFDTMESGLRAMARVLLNYYSHGFTTPRAIAFRYAPPRDNNPTEAYAANIADALDVAPDERIEIPDELADLMRAMVRQELGSVASAFVSDGSIVEGIRRALS